MKKLLALVLALVMCMVLAAPACAVEAEYTNTQYFLRLLKDSDIKYSVIVDNSTDYERVDVSITGDEFTYTIKYFFDSDNESISLRVWNIVDFSMVDYGKVLQAVNTANDDYLFVKFSVDTSDYSVTASMDLIVREGSESAEITWDATCYLISILDEVYVTLSAYADSSNSASAQQSHTHNWMDATCTTPRTCTICGATEGSALGHNWKDATQSAPKTCTRCGETEGDPLGYIEYIDWEYSEVSIQVGMTSAYPCILDEQVKNCYQFSVYGVISSIDYGESVLKGDWRVFVRNAQKEWKQVGTIKVNGLGEYETTLYLDSPISFDAISVVPPAGISANYRYSGTFISLCYYVK